MRTVASGVHSGLVIADTYRITKRIGEGGMGSVWEAEHLRLRDKKVAIKFLHEDVVSDSESLARFEREANIAASLHHPNIANVHDYNHLDDGTPYFVLELLEGEDLDSRIARGAIPEDEALEILRDIGAALRAAHAAGVIHRDLKPGNIYLCTTRDGGRGPVKVLDFGISKIRGSTTVKTQTQTVLGTPQYMSPEQATGKHDQVDPRTDIFCLGIIAFEMLSGQPPFTGETVPEVVFKIVYEPEPKLAELVPTLMPQVVSAVHQALAKDPDERFPSVDAFMAAMGITVRTSTNSDRPERDTGPAAMAATLDSGAARRSDLNELPLAEPLTPDSSAAMTQVRAPAAPADSSAPKVDDARRRLGLIAAALVGILAIAGAASAITIYALGGSANSTVRPPPPRAVESVTHADPPSPPTASAEEELAPNSEATSSPESAPIGVPGVGGMAGNPGLEEGETDAGQDEIEAPTTHERVGNLSPNPDMANDANSGPPSPNSDPPPTPGANEDEAAPADNPVPPRTVRPLPYRRYLPRLRELAHLSPGSRALLVEATREIRRGNYRSAAGLAFRARDPRGRGVALRVEIVARCLNKEQSATPALIRQLGPAARRALTRFCASHGLDFDL